MRGLGVGIEHAHARTIFDDANNISGAFIPFSIKFLAQRTGFGVSDRDQAIALTISREGHHE